MRPSIALLLAASLVLASATARADPPAPPTPAESHEQATRWYGYQTLATDGVALLFFVPAQSSASSATKQGFAMGTLTMYGVGAPIVHLAHGHVGKALLDLGLRVGMPLALGAAGYAIGASSREQADGLGGVVGAGFGALLGAAGASAIDAIVVAREPVSPPCATPAPAAEAPRSSAKIEPTFGLSPERGGGTRAVVGVVGVF